MTLPSILLALSLLLIVVLYRFITGYNPLRAIKLTWPKRKPDTKRDESIKKTVELMKCKPEVVNAVYARTQRHSNDIAYIFALLPLLLSMATIDFGEELTWFNNLMIWVFAAFATVALWALGRIDDRTQYYLDVIDRYEAELGMDKPM